MIITFFSTYFHIFHKIESNLHKIDFSKEIWYNKVTGIIYPDAEKFYKKIFRSDTMKQSATELMVPRRQFDELFPIVRASLLSIEDPFMLYTPETQSQYETLQSLKMAISSGLTDFRKPAIDPSILNGKIVFDAEIKPSFNHSPVWWSEKAKAFRPSKNSRLMSPMANIGFLGVILKHMVEELGLEKKQAWSVVCDDSMSLGQYWYSAGMKHDFTFCNKWCDLTVTGKILEDENGFYIAGVDFDYSDTHAIANIKKIPSYSNSLVYSGTSLVGSIITDV